MENINDEKILQYLEGSLSEAEAKAFGEKIKKNKILAREVALYRAIYIELFEKLEADGSFDDNTLEDSKMDDENVLQEARASLSKFVDELLASKETVITKEAEPVKPKPQKKLALILFAGIATSIIFLLIYSLFVYCKKTELVEPAKEKTTSNLDSSFVLAPEKGENYQFIIDANSKNFGTIWTTDFGAGRTEKNEKIIDINCFTEIHPEIAAEMKMQRANYNICNSTRSASSKGLSIMEICESLPADLYELPNEKIINILESKKEDVVATKNSFFVHKYSIFLAILYFEVGKIREGISILKPILEDQEAKNNGVQSYYQACYYLSYFYIKNKNYSNAKELFIQNPKLLEHEIFGTKANRILACLQ